MRSSVCARLLVEWVLLLSKIDWWLVCFTFTQNHHIRILSLTLVFDGLVGSLGEDLESGVTTNVEFLGQGAFLSGIHLSTWGKPKAQSFW